jgi:predicted dehydrogenase
MADYVNYYQLIKDVTPPPADVLARLKAESRAALSSAIGSDDDYLVKTYHEILLDSLIHEMNTLRSLLGEPTRLDYVELRPSGVTAVLQFGAVPAVINWIDVPGITRYRQEFAFYAPDRRLTLAFPSPFLRSAPTILEDEGGEPGTGRSWHTEEITSYDEAFRRELMHFHDAVTKEQEPLTAGLDGLRDVALCRSFIAGHLSGQAIDSPTAF